MTVRSGADDELLLCGGVSQHPGLSLSPHWSQAGEEMAADALGGLEHPQSDNITDGDICSSRQGGDWRQKTAGITLLICSIPEPHHPRHLLYWTEHLLHHVCLLLLPGAQ